MTSRQREFALLTGRCRALRHVTASPSKIGDITRTALVLTHFEYGYISMNFAGFTSFETYYYDANARAANCRTG